MACLQIGHQLSLMDPLERLNRLQLDNDTAADNKIQSMRSDTLTSIRYGKHPLALEGNATRG